MRGEASTQALLLVESGSETACRLETVLKNKDMLHFSEEVWNKQSMAEFRKCIMGNFSIDQLSDSVKTFLDPRIIKARTLIDNLEEKKIFANEIATALFLSETRFIHLFKQETGISFRRYVLWKRMMDSIKILIDARDITQAAHEAGFADSAHLARTFKDNFGIILSEIFKNDRFVQVIICTSQ